MLVCGVSFKDNGKIYNFDCNDIQVEKDHYVIVETEKGEQLGKAIYIEEKSVKQTLKCIIREATDQDYNKYLKNLKDAKDALNEAKKLALTLNLNMQITDASYTFDRKQLLFNFIADERIDFRELVKELASKYHTRIELHQMGIRDKAKEIGGLGPCGRPLCCSQFLNRMDTITINMAKNQNIALNPTKINGSCGRLLCCLAYEDGNYSECRAKLPNVGSKVTFDKQTGTVISIDILNQKYKVDFSGDIREYNINDKK
jgi:cell fate regulator YaaT (PSP1 superfamily)